MNLFPVVAVGASAGGLEAYKEFFHALPSDTGMAFVLIQHLDPSHESMLTEIIAKATTMPVEEVRSGASIRSNHVYVIPPNSLMALSDGVFQLSPRRKAAGQHLAVNFFMRSLAEERKGSAIGIILSGTGADGTAGLENIKAEGGITFAQDPATAKYDGMPRSAIDSGCADFILAPRDIATELRRIQHHPYVRAEKQDVEDLSAEKPAVEESAKEEQGRELDESVAPSSHARDFSAVLAQLRKASGVDFSQYKPNTIHRRALRRMLLLKIDSLRDYADYLKEHAEEGQKLYDDLLIPVTSFFRDFEAFETLKTQVFPAIVKDKGNKGVIRIWAPGCSTGEETYSLAMILLECLGDRASSFQVQIFGTDLNDKSIQKARAGVYRESIADEISPGRIARFFVKVEGGYRVNKAVRDMCVFARQNLANDPPFSQMNLVACRNLLIYIQPALQKKIIPILHYALKPSGFLILGSSESVSAFPELFSTVDKKHKIYAKKPIASRLHYDFVQSYYPLQSGISIPGKVRDVQPSDKDEVDIQAEADRIVLREHAPVGVVINRDMEVVQFRGQTAPYLAPPPGRPSVNVLKLARNGLAIELRALILSAKKKGGIARKSGIAFFESGQKRMLNLSITPLGEKRPTENESREKHFFLVLFDDVTSQWTQALDATSERKTKGRRENDQESKRLNQELAGTRDALRSAIESEDSLKEEFQSANEEILSANEELQSTNEELETSKEELQSANEELGTLNAELHNKNNELHDLNNDISNLLNSTRIPVVMLDRQLHIRRITPAESNLFRTRPADLGRPFADIKLNIEASDMTSHDLELQIAKVLDLLQPIEREVRDLEGHWHGLSILPYRTQDNKIDGVVLAVQDIHAIKSANQQLAKSAAFFHGIIDTVREPLLVLDHGQRVVAVNESFLSTFEVSLEQTVNRMLYELGNGQWNIPELRKLLDRVLPKREIVTDFEVNHDFESIGHRKMLLNARRLVQLDQSQPMILLAIEDITERKNTEMDLARLAAIVECSDDAIIGKNLDGIIQTWNRGAELLFGYKEKEAIGQPITMLMPRDRVDEEAAILKRIRRGEHITHYESVRRHKDGRLLDVSLTISPLMDAHGQIVGASKIARDISARKMAEAALIKSEKLAAAGRLAATLAHEINNPLQAVTNLVSMLAQTPGLDAQGQAHAAMAESELRRVSHLTQQSLSFYRESVSPTNVDLGELIDNVLGIYRKRIDAKGINVTRRYQVGSTTIKTYPGEIRQVLSTLLLNAIEAVEEGGAIAVRARKAAHWQKRSLRGVRVTIADNGMGIPAQNILRIFEPFFTTKGENGTGLGLWVASGIVDRSGGSILIRSSVRAGRHGTCFSIFLPTKS
ncbi:chemotaxis protein CheB [Acidicapsa dinghuensis]|uniref:Chemotaxis protein CheB n=1 Tax=Acidicapsa dinghuensis TaxID=2218256 RepID=A0ABW1EFW2_9BACT